MLSKTRRLTRVDFIATKKTGRTLRTPYFSYIFNPTSTAKVAIVTSSKLSKKAVIRNRLRRQIYAHFQNISLPGNIIIYPTPAMLNLTSEEISSSLHSALSSLTSS